LTRQLGSKSEQTITLLQTNRPPAAHFRQHSTHSRFDERGAALLLLSRAAEFRSQQLSILDQN
jgi:hypothetical protein